ncbi:MAG TPA: hypothetical protein VGV59_21510 [Pyrinomonadaceae bacterium]|nr:hypothetical protein [Pyrinomonadaceae bacterium]
MQLILKNKTFALKSATLSATVPDPYWLRKYHPKGDARLFWSLDVEAAPESGDDGWEPRASHENLHFPIWRWMEVSGQVVEWSEPHDEESGELNGWFYVFEHEEIPRARLRFMERSGVAFRFEWEGVCNILWDEDYDRDVPFSASGWAKFTGVTVLGSESDTDETLRGRLAAYLDPRDFVQGPLQRVGHRYDSGVKMAHASFIPL